MDDPQPALFILTPRPRGRPRSTIPKSSVSAHVPTTLHDRLIELANQHEISVSRLMYRVLDEALRGKSIGIISTE